MYTKFQKKSVNLELMQCLSTKQHQCSQTQKLILQMPGYSPQDGQDPSPQVVADPIRIKVQVIQRLELSVGDTPICEEKEKIEYYYNNDKAHHFFFSNQIVTFHYWLHSCCCCVHQGQGYGQPWFMHRLFCSCLRILIRALNIKNKGWYCKFSAYRTLS